MATLISNSNVMTTEALNSLVATIPEWRALKSEVDKAEKAGLNVAMTSKQIQEKIDSLVQIINVYSTTRYSP